MSESSGHIRRIQDIAEGAGLQFSATSADAGKIVARQLRDEGDEDILLAVLADGCSVHLRKMLSDSRKAVVRDAARLATEPTPIDRQLLLPLDYPITVPGEKTIPLRIATRADVRAALAAIQGVRRGYDNTERQLERILTATEGQADDERIGDIVNRGAVSIDSLFGKAA